MFFAASWIEDGPTSITAQMIDYLTSKNIIPIMFFMGNNWKNILKKGFTPYNMVLLLAITVIVILVLMILHLTNVTAKLKSRKNCLSGYTKHLQLNGNIKFFAFLMGQKVTLTKN